MAAGALDFVLSAPFIVLRSILVCRFVLPFLPRFYRIIYFSVPINILSLNWFSAVRLFPFFFTLKTGTINPNAPFFSFLL